jgi:hypothetical protein
MSQRSTPGMDSPIVIVGAPRSGTSAFSIALHAVSILQEPGLQGYPEGHVFARLTASVSFWGEWADWPLASESASSDCALVADLGP